MCCLPWLFTSAGSSGSGLGSSTATEMGEGSWGFSSSSSSLRGKSAMSSPGASAMLVCVHSCFWGLKHAKQLQKKTGFQRHGGLTFKKNDPPEFRNFLFGMCREYPRNKAFLGGTSGVELKPLERGHSLFKGNYDASQSTKVLLYIYFTNELLFREWTLKLYQMKRLEFI